MFRNQTVLRVPLPHILLEVTLDTFFFFLFLFPSDRLRLPCLLCVFFRPLRQAPALHFEQVPLYACLDTIFCLLSRLLYPRISEQKSPFLPY